MSAKATRAGDWGPSDSTTSGQASSGWLAVSDDGHIPALHVSGTPRILVAGIGNIFLGDDAFGVETVRELMQHRWPAGVRVIDFGIRSYDLAFALADSYDAVILIDAAARGQVPGTLYLVEIEQEQIARAQEREANPHSVDPVAAIRMANAIGNPSNRIYLIGCEPAVLESESGQTGLSPTVQAALTPAVELIHALVRHLLSGTKGKECDQCP
jgi:hydrogenase maturation protease